MCVSVSVCFLNSNSISSVRAARGGVPDSLFLVSFLCPADHERDWPQCLVVLSGWQLIRAEADSSAYEKLIRKWTKSVCFFRDQKHERRPSYAYGFGLLCFRQTRTGLPMRVRYSNEIAEWKWPPIFQNKRVRYARKSRRAGPLQ